MYATVSVRAGFHVPSSILGGICSCIWVSDHMIICLDLFLRYLDIPNVPCLTGSPKLLEVLLCDCEKFTRKCSL